MTAVSGTVSLEFWPAERHNVPVTVEIRQGNLTVQTTTVTLTPNGTTGDYTVPLLHPLDYGTYNVTIKASHWLRALGQNVTIPGGTFNASLKNGDATNDNVVDVLDLNYVLLHWGSAEPSADLDGSGLVDLPDISIVLLNFTMQGAPPATNGASAPTLEGLSGNGRNLLFIDLGSSSNPYAPYRVYRKAGGGNYSLVGETPMRLFLDTSATNGTAYTYKACVLNASGGESPFSPEVVLTPTTQNPTCTATIASEGTHGAARGLVVAEGSSLSAAADNLALCIDGQYVAFALDNDPVMVYESERGRNGLIPAVVVVWDEQERYGFSDLVPMTFVNEFSLMSLTEYEINPVASPPQSVVIACKLKEPQNYRIDVIEDFTSQVVRSLTSPAPSHAVSWEWDGKNAAGNPVPDSTYLLVVTLTDKTPPLPSRPERIEVSRVIFGQHRAVIVQGSMDSAHWRIQKVQAVKMACRAVDIPFKVFGYYSTRWADDGDRKGLASYLAHPNTRMFYFTGHGMRRLSQVWQTSFWLGLNNQDDWKAAPDHVAENRRVSADMVQALNIDPEQYRLVWVDACGSGTHRSTRDADLMDPFSWMLVPRLWETNNDMATAFGIGRPDFWIDNPAYYIGYHGYAYSNKPYADMVRLFFEQFSAGNGTVYTIRQVMIWLWGRSEVTDPMPGCSGGPYIDPEGQLTCCPPYFNIRVFTDTVKDQWTYPNDYDGLKMSDMRY